MEKIKRYASLINSLLSLYYPLEPETEEKQRLMLNSSSLKRLWCSVYTEEEVDKQIARFGGQKLPDEFIQRLDYDYSEVYADD